MNSFKKQNVINLIISYSGIFLAFFITIIKAKVLNTEEIGVISILTTVSIFAGFIVNLGLNSIITKFHFKVNKDQHKKAALNLYVFIGTFLSYSLVTFLLLAFKDILLRRFENDLLNTYFSLIFIIIFAEAANKIWIAIFRVEKRSVLCNFIYDFLFKTLSLLLLISSSIGQFSFKTYILLYTLLYLIRTILFIIIYFSDFSVVKPNVQILNMENIRVATHYSFFMFFGGLASILTRSIDKLMLGALLNIKSVGIYTIIVTFPVLIQAIGSALSMTSNPLISELWSKKKKTEIQKLYTANINIQMFLGFFVFSIFTTFGKPILLFIGDEYLIGYSALVLLMIGELVNLSAGLSGSIIIYSKYYFFDFYIRLALILITILTNFIFIPLWGLSGAAFATSISLIIYNFIKVVFLKIKLGFSPYSKKSLLFVVVSAFFLFILIILQMVLMINNIFYIFGFSLFVFILYSAIHKYFVKLDFLINLKIPHRK